MLYALLKTLHLLAIIVWIGGMVFAHFFLRPALASLDPPARLKLMCEVLRRFLAAVTMAATVALVSGLGMVAVARGQAAASGFKMPLDWIVMATLGLVMVAIFAYVRAVLYPRMRRAVEAALWPVAAAAMNDIRRWVSVNLALGVLIVALTLLV